MDKVPTSIVVTRRLSDYSRKEDHTTSIHPNVREENDRFRIKFLKTSGCLTVLGLPKGNSLLVEYIHTKINRPCYLCLLQYYDDL